MPYQGNEYNSPSLEDNLTRRVIPVTYACTPEYYSLFTFPNHFLGLSLIYVHCQPIRHPNMPWLS
jgi:hypothetical protein